jgi:hypothetical protein
MLAMAKLCPPPPTVPSTKISPGRGASQSRTSESRTGTWPLESGEEAEIFILCIKLESLHPITNIPEAQKFVASCVDIPNVPLKPDWGEDRQYKGVFGAENV